jgi:hypothetical protein
MKENNPRFDTANQSNQSNLPEMEQARKDPLPWLIRNLRQRHQELTEGSQVKDPREQTQ